MPGHICEPRRLGLGMLVGLGAWSDPIVTVHADPVAHRCRMVVVAIFAVVAVFRPIGAENGWCGDVKWLGPGQVLARTRL